eukprot:969686-Pelagomonas_calceolata.AAC.5
MSAACNQYAFSNMCSCLAHALFNLLWGLVEQSLAMHLGLADWRLSPCTLGHGRPLQSIPPGIYDAGSEWPSMMLTVALNVGCRPVRSVPPGHL